MQFEFAVFAGSSVSCSARCWAASRGDLDADRAIHRADRRLSRADRDLSTQHYGIPIPELTYGKAIAQIGERETQLVKDGLAILCTKEACPIGTLRPHIQPS